MKLTLRLDSDNDAFAVDGESEVARLLRKTADAIEEGHSSGLLHRSGHLIWLAREVGPGRMAIVPKPCPQEFRDDVVRVARERESGVTLAQIAKDFGIHEMTLQKWLRRAAIDEGRTPGTTSTESADLRELRKRNRLLEQENEVLRRAAAYLSQASLQGKGSTRS